MKKLLLLNTMKKLLLILLCVPLIGFGQKEIKNLKVNVRNFNPEMPISVAFLRSDRLNVVEALENAFFTNGFDVISKSVAEEKATLTNNINKNEKSTNQQIIIDTKSKTYYEAVYVVEISYTTKISDLKGRCIYVLSGRIIDLINDGKLVGTFELRQGAFQAKNAEEIMNTIAYKLSKSK